ncbi:AAA family ATPase [Staphylococcus coagulans]|uniref:AAA family ATPase n=1 Tax=Staphylococcus coagulans TaxID=74706 RepID=UPI001BEA676C|nr:AAA family ATPase [Staphylococcus coagulans]MBT2831083.1 AAA family ATPase [Staphylococcus coagulans]MBT2859534.1 AAA family ATPase [Staphylococcus coagulans]MBU3873044.1 AAA family ATPase [Staphylococcus coagulans]UNB48622.1 AAA family ATPase [Staphylococcus coagulans]
MIFEISLPIDRFDNKKMSGFKRKNFIYGKNGTGKSSITEEIINQYSDSHNVFVFQGFHSVIAENGKLNAISLGSENAKLQAQIDIQNKVVNKLTEDLINSDELNSNTFSQLNIAKNKLGELEHKIDDFYRRAASRIKNNHPEWTGIKYNKNDFKRDIKYADSLSDDEVLEQRNNEKQSTIDVIKKVNLNEIDGRDVLESVNQIITISVTKSVVLNFQSSDKMNWVKKGLHLHAEGDYCAFCGSIVNKSRLDDLNSYFNDEMKNLEKKIDDEVTIINNRKTEIKKLKELEINKFYTNFHSKINEVNTKIMKYKEDYNIFFDSILNALAEKKENIFLPLKKLTINPPSGFSEIVLEINDLVNENIIFHNNLEEIKKEARAKLKLNEVSIELKENNYYEIESELEKIKFHKEKIKTIFDNKQEELSVEKEKLKSLLSKTVDESKAAENINKLLKRLGNQSFTLINVNEDGQKGQYSIKGYDEELRDIETLSTGEKNIVAFLWFMYNLENIKLKASNDTVIIFDDPMNSNDDTVQYLIIAKIQELLKNIGDRQIFILTHNVHFYLNARYLWWNGHKKETYDKTTIHLFKNGVKTQFNFINNEEDDLKTSYDALWSEVKWLYIRRKPEMMLNPLRRIFETYLKFNNIKGAYLDDIEARKLFNVNSHSIDDLEVDLNGKDERQLMEKVKYIFDDIGGKDHFDHYWK